MYPSNNAISSTVFGEIYPGIIKNKSNNEALNLQEILTFLINIQTNHLLLFNANVLFNIRFNGLRHYRSLIETNCM